jgi:hypothetical protein
MLAVLEDALRCVQTCAAARTPIRRRMFFEAQAWLSDRTARGPFAFEAVCDALGIQPNRLRDRIREWSATIGRDELPPPDAEALGGQKCGAHRLPGPPRTTAHERVEPLRAVSPLGVARKGGSKNAGR